MISWLGKVGCVGPITDESLDDEQAGRKRRRASTNVDYKALDEKLKQEANSPNGNGRRRTNWIGQEEMRCCELRKE